MFIIYTLDNFLFWQLVIVYSTFVFRYIMVRLRYIRLIVGLCVYCFKTPCDESRGYRTMPDESGYKATEKSDLSDAACR